MESECKCWWYIYYFFGIYNLHGEEFKVIVKDLAGNVSEAVSVKAPLDDIAPNPIKNIVLDANGQNFTAQAEANSQIEVFDSFGNQIGWGSTDSTGNVTGYFYQVYLHGEELTFVVIDRMGNRSVELKLNALVDTIAPDQLKTSSLTKMGKILRHKQKPIVLLVSKMLRVSLSVMVMSIALVMCPVTSIRFI